MKEESLTENKIYTVNIWKYNSNGLYDYERDNFIISSFKTEFGFFYKDINNKISFSHTLEQDTDKKKYLVTLQKKDDKYILYKRFYTNLPINTKTVNNLLDQIWYVIKTNSIKEKKFTSNFKYEIKKNDIIKIGRMKFLIKDMNIIGKDIKKSIETFIPYEINELSNIKRDENCRICYSNDNSIENNPMISICKCKGSMNLHLECLKKWIKSKLQIKEINNKPGISYIIQQFKCEICKEPYPITIKNNNNYYNLINYNIPVGQNYIILQSLNLNEEKNYPFSIHVLIFIENNYSYIIGRGHENDIRISSISVSRIHSRIYMKDDKFFMEDLGSKFGTLVLAKEPVYLYDGIIYQIGNSLFYYGKEDIKNNNKDDNNFEKNKKSLSSLGEEL